ncbi:MAG: phenol hydroxylase [Rhodomicrobium sp.]
MTIQIKTIDLEPKRQTFGHVARRLGGDKTASRYLEGTLDVQATDNFHYKPLWETEYWHYDTRKTAVKMADWYKPLDPRQYYYATYNIARANMQQAVDRNFVFVAERGLIEKLGRTPRIQIERGLLPLRHLHWGSNMNMSEICQRGYGTAVTAPCIFSAGDHLAMAQIISRVGLELDGQNGTSLDGAKINWMKDSAWQPIRRLIEDTLVERDWFHLYVAQTLGVNAVLFELAYKNADVAWADGGILVAMLTEFMTDWRAEEARWSDSVVKTVAAESAENNALISGWAQNWISRAVEAGKSWSRELVGDRGRAADAAGETAIARARSLGLKV